MGQRTGIDADAVLAAQLEWLRKGNEASPKRRKLNKKLANELPKLHSAEADMRRTFKRWDKHRAEVQRIERLLDALDAEESNSG